MGDVSTVRSVGSDSEVLRSLRDLLPAGGCETAKAEVKRNCECEQADHWPYIPVKPWSWLDLELVPACEDLSERDRRDREEIERETKRRCSKPNRGGNSGKHKRQDNGDDEESGSDILR